ARVAPAEHLGRQSGRLEACRRTGDEQQVCAGDQRFELGGLEPGSMDALREVERGTSVWVLVGWLPEVEVDGVDLGAGVGEGAAADGSGEEAAELEHSDARKEVGHRVAE